MHSELEAGKLLRDVRDYLRKGDDDFRGLDQNPVLRDYRQWDFKVWVLPQLPGCSEMYRWDLDYSLPASDFCDEDAMAKEDGKSKLFLEVRIFSRLSE